ncbi:ribose-phosphate diphosphokinase [Flavobacterium johnsoniae]|uniref:Ribose-phosphate pyrophosphokinase n=1 Tax=Flavobacterium johnsoniae (strain ATCC 17061 / DSM 2064 / JCM 8514 / BCRC 14874 / CCUG 350202 / NBRC 14942 / NCIMB 11054 / UW101) TaxID=376686 RepID=A5FLY3_FLAJ1|nr:ribose-phosphate diphosphokinase [Flavobacterium johnsoniae]ABQ03790.1 ribose-phosphate pyrophosphokinase [Flavobacterium johnsoniae UW101]OXG03312.1 phosphoribosylpyrophosphate synthetase [Flavobacterium johnsoniae UW101]WQG79346.1 ribose-phosphate diphosphokinase [Flavobacterium johnsoniae UW101]SHK02800.1 ribose-phosphate pyrophosphokinase [Flavobacterium johnsoniae]
MILNLDPKFAPFQNQEEIKFQSFTFSGGEPHIKIVPDFDTNRKITITHRLNSFNDLGLLCVTVDALRRMDVKIIELFIPYFPAARQDRVMIPGEPLSVKVYADIINAMQLNKVFVFDAHSEVTPALLNNSTVIPNYAFIKEVLNKIGQNVKLISPDGGALKKIYKVSEFLGGVEVVECSKSRDVKTGKLSGFKVYEDDLQGMDCLIVDDICDGGGTFVGLAEELKKKNAGKLYLAVSHGIFNKGFEVLDCFDKIFTTNSFKDFDDQRVEVVKFEL